MRRGTLVRHAQAPTIPAAPEDGEWRAPARSHTWCEQEHGDPAWAERSHAVHCGKQVAAERLRRSMSRAHRRAATTETRGLRDVAVQWSSVSLAALDLGALRLGGSAPIGCGGPPFHRPLSRSASCVLAVGFPSGACDGCGGTARPPRLRGVLPRRRSAAVPGRLSVRCVSTRASLCVPY